MAPERPVIAIDGPAGSGKGTLAKALAARLGYLYVDSGAMYRCVALRARRLGTDFADKEALARVAREADIDLRPGAERLEVWLDGEEVENLIRTPELSRLTSASVANSPGVRAALVERQRQLGARGGLVMEGRDIGTVVFPQAELKIFLEVSPQERARRRMLDYQARGIPFSPDAVLGELLRRDEEDRQRPVGPLRRAPDAHLLLGDGKDVPALLAEALALLPPAARPAED